jgi:hypothetical protein
LAGETTDWGLLEKRHPDILFIAGLCDDNIQTLSALMHYGFSGFNFA